MIEVNNVCKAYGRHQVLRDVNVGFGQGMIHGIIGRNGSGKSQLFKVICGYVKPDSGQVRVDGRLIGREIDFPPSLGLLIESPGFLTGFSGLFNLQMLAAMNSKTSKTELLSLLDLVGLKDAARKRVGRYSMGMQQRLAISQTLIGNPRLLILDEPFNGLDKSGVRDIHALLLEKKSQGLTILLSSHNPYDIKALCDTVHEMDAGVITQR